MEKVFADERRNSLIEFLTKHQRASVKELSRTLNVSEATLRSDLNVLEEEGIVRRIHGGAVLNDQPNRPEYSYSVREKTNVAEKTAIGIKAMELVRDGQCIILDASTTCLELAKCLRRQAIRLTVVTNGVYTALELRDNPGINVILIGGVLRVGSAALEGTLGVDLFGKIKVDTMFTAPAGFTVEAGLMDFNMYEVELKSRMAKASPQLVSLVDHSKINQSSIACYAETAQIHTFITDDKAPRTVLDELGDRRVSVLVAQGG